MTPHQIELVKTSFAFVAPVREQLAKRFYDRLFEIEPNVRPLFKGNIVEQGAKLMNALAFVVSALDEPERLLPKVDALARRHHAYGVREAHYDTVGHALLWALHATLGPAFTAAVCIAWAAAYDLLSKRMIAAAVEMPA